MKRAKLLAAIAVAGTLALAACSNSSGGSPAPASTPTTSSVMPTSSATSGGSGTAVTSGTGGAGSATAGSSQTQASDTGSSQTEASDTTSTDESTITVGGAVDGQTAAWFSAFCTGMAPLITAATGGMQPTGSGDMQTLMVNEFNSLGEAMTNTAAILKPLPPPTFTNGTQFASDVVTALSQAGPQMKSAAAAIKAVDPTNATALQTAIESAGNSMSSSMSTLSKYSLDDNTQKAMASIPACKPFADEASGDSTTTG